MIFQLCHGLKIAKRHGYKQQGQPAFPDMLFPIFPPFPRCGPTPLHRANQDERQRSRETLFVKRSRRKMIRWKTIPKKDVDERKSNLLLVNSSMLSLGLFNYRVRVRVRVRGTTLAGEKKENTCKLHEFVSISGIQLHL